ncbi:FtsW/RodA/SpoVE family cell cycle protein [Pseudothermotoga thermarum]|uniref:Probable peptidoglycan glycosyltransferase FtsW n=1 Tax=Pseudothermotoga thermarum DSM 5069 TaxID=688269 RepID=F7YXX4_9THEM|nr:FtsW/RodA/SpoVE family cell cycle protein [Pseudothermotoga thermarum]AEH50773.1 cell cycle protein [Pseudothermotoga thermarum DSM 5069]
MSEQLSIVFVVAILIVVGMILISSVDVASQLVLFGNLHRNILKKHIENLVIGVLVMTITTMIDYKIHEKISGFYYLLSISLLFTPFFYSPAGGSRRWIDLGAFNFQPSEFAKLALIIFLSSYISHNKQHMKEFFKGFLIPLLLIFPMVVLVFLEPDMSTASIMFALTLLLLYSHGANGFYVLATVISSIVVLFVCAKMNLFFHDYQLWRLKVFFEEQIPQQLAKALQAIKEGGLVGKGVGLGNVKLAVPAVVTDFILAVAGEEFGIIGIIGITLLFLILIFILLKSIEKLSDTFATSFITGYAFLILLQVLVNLGVITGLVPITGVTLPFISYGGSSMVTMLCGFGIVINILTRREEEEQR